MRKYFYLVGFSRLYHEKCKTVNEFLWMAHLSSEESFDTWFSLERLQLDIFLGGAYWSFLIFVYGEPQLEAMLKLIHRAALRIFVDETCQFRENPTAKDTNIWILWKKAAFYHI